MREDNVTGEIKEKLLKLQKKRRLAFFVMICFFPIGVFIAKTLESSPFAGILIFVYFIFTGFLLTKVAFHKCPRCHKFFFFSSSWANGFTNKCLNCGINFRGEEL
ncbi:MAG: hypothetical protein GY737_25805 [Desulfobacteraceae bacterium]|nr:hypothetical protein [Desulfobacteraceae bacterium]